MTSGEIVTLTLALIAIVPATIAAIVGAKNAKATNDAVNHTHRDGTRLYDLALENHEKVDEIVAWKRSYDQSPWKDGQKVQTWLKDHEKQHADLMEKLNGLEVRPPCAMHEFLEEENDTGDNQST